MLPDSPPLPGPLAVLVDRLACHPLVTGVLVIGSAGRGRLTPASDFDLLVILRQRPVPLRAILTQLHDREAEVFFVTIDQVRAILADGPPVAPESDAAFVVQWLQNGRLAFDRAGLIARAQHACRARAWLLPAGAADHYALWFKLNSYLRQLERLAVSVDPVDLVAAELTLARAAEELLLAGVVLRGEPWHGAKDALRRLAERDPAVFAQWQALFAAPRLDCRLQNFRRLAAGTLAPLGGLWRPGEDGLQLEPGTFPAPELLARARGFWAALHGSVG